MNEQMKYILILGILILNSGINLNAQTTSELSKTKNENGKRSFI